MRQWRLYAGGLGICALFFAAYRLLGLIVPRPAVPVEVFEPAIRKLYWGLRSWEGLLFLLLATATLPALVIRRENTAAMTGSEQGRPKDGGNWRLTSSIYHGMMFVVGMVLVYFLLPSGPRAWVDDLWQSLPSIIIALFIGVPAYLLTHRAWLSDAGWGAHGLAATGLLLSLGLFGVTVLPVVPWVFVILAVLLLPTTFLVLPTVGRGLSVVHEHTKHRWPDYLVWFSGLVLLVGLPLGVGLLVAERDIDTLVLIVRLVALALVILVLGIAVWHCHGRRRGELASILHRLGWLPDGWIPLDAPVLKPPPPTVDDTGTFAALFEAVSGLLAGVVRFVIDGTNLVLQVASIGASLVVTATLWAAALIWNFVLLVALYSFFTLIDLPDYLAAIMTDFVLKPMDQAFRFCFVQLAAYACAVGGLALLLDSAIDYLLVSQFRLLPWMALGQAIWLFGIILSLAVVRRDTLRQSANLLLIDHDHSRLQQMMGYGLGLFTVASWLLVLLAPQVGIEHFRPGFLTWTGTAVIAGVTAFYGIGGTQKGRTFRIVAAIVVLLTAGAYSVLSARPSPSHKVALRSKDGATLIYVPAGEFSMGSSNSDSEAEADEKPQHFVALDAFWIDKTEVTNARYRNCVRAGICKEARCSNDSYFDAPDQPVVCVDWNDAQTYCAWAGAGLPTEAEWEKAARGADGRVYPWGNAFDAGRLNFCDRTCTAERRDTTADDGYSWPAPVGNYLAGAGPYGALDLAGNVWEWVADWYDGDYYANSQVQNPSGPEVGEYRVMRGGSWCQSMRFVRSASRYTGMPSDSWHDVGFRCAMSTAAQGSSPTALRATAEEAVALNVTPLPTSAPGAVNLPTSPQVVGSTATGTATGAVTVTNGPPPPLTETPVDTPIPLTTSPIKPTAVAPSPTRTPFARTAIPSLPAATPCNAWHLPRDFRLWPDQQNPSPDKCGNLKVWHFMESASLRRDPATYSILPNFVPDTEGMWGIESWQGTHQESWPNSRTPSVAVNATGADYSPPYPVNWSAGAFLVHPAPTQLVIVGWRSPINGSIAIAGFVRDMNTGGGDGVDWYLAKGAQDLAHGSLPNGGHQAFGDGEGGSGLQNVPVAEGDFIYLIVDPKDTYGWDSTQVEVEIVSLTAKIPRLPVG